MTALVPLCAAAAVALLLPPVVRLPRWTTPATAAATARRPVPTSAVAGVAAAVLAVVLVSWPFSLVAAPLLGAVVARAVGRLEPAAARRRRLLLEAALPQVVDLMSLCLTSGGSPAGGVAQVARVMDEPMREELAAFARRLDLGADPLAVWSAMAGHAQLAPLGRALQRSAESGASVAPALARLGDELHRERRALTQARARTIEVRASLPLGLCLLPAFVLVGVVPMVAGSASLTFLVP